MSLWHSPQASESMKKLEGMMPAGVGLRRGGREGRVRAGAFLIHGDRREDGVLYAVVGIGPRAAVKRAARRQQYERGGGVHEGHAPGARDAESERGADRQTRLRIRPGQCAATAPIGGRSCCRPPRGRSRAVPTAGMRRSPRDSGGPSSAAHTIRAKPSPRCSRTLPM